MEFEVHNITSLIIAFILLLRRFLHAILEFIQLYKEYHVLEITRMHDPAVWIADQAHALVYVVEQGQLYFLAALVVDYDEKI